MTSLGKVADVEKLICNSLQTPNGTGTAGQVIESDGASGIRWGSGAGPAHVNNPMTANLDLGGFDLIGQGVFQGSGFSLLASVADDTPPVPSVDGAIYAMKVKDGTFGKKPYQQNLNNASGGFPTQQPIFFNGGCPITGPVMLAEGLGTLSPGGITLAAKPGIQTGATDDCLYDPSNCRGTLAGSSYFAFWLQDTLPGVSGTYGTDPVKGNLFVECDYSCDFGSQVGNEIVIKLEHSGSSNPGTGVPGATIATYTIDDRKSDSSKIVGSASKMIVAIDPSVGVSVGDAFAVFAECPASSARGCDCEIKASFTWIPSP